MENFSLATAVDDPGLNDRDDFSIRSQPTKGKPESSKVDIIDRDFTQVSQLPQQLQDESVDLILGILLRHILETLLVDAEDIATLGIEVEHLVSESSEELAVMVPGGAETMRAILPVCIEKAPHMTANEIMEVFGDGGLKRPEGWLEILESCHHRISMRRAVVAMNKTPISPQNSARRVQVLISTPR